MADTEATEQALAICQQEADDVQRQIDELLAEGRAETKFGRDEQRERFVQLTKQQAEIAAKLKAWSEASRLGLSTSTVQ